MTETTVRAGDLALHVRREGEGSPVLLLHGVTDSGACWAPVIDDLAGEFDVVVPDARGHGTSSRVASSFGFADLADDAAAVIRATVGGPVAVWGHSMGAATAAALAAAHPALVSRLVLEDPSFTDSTTADDGPVGEEARNGTRRMLAELRAVPTGDRVRGARERNPDWGDAELEGWATSKVEFDDGVLEHRRTGIDWRATAERIAAPVLLVTGDPERGAIVTPAVAAEFLSRHPATRVQRFAGAGHSVHREAYPAVLAAVREFLRSGN